MPTPPRSRWFQFSLRMMFILVALASLGFGWLGLKMRQAQDRRRRWKPLRSWRLRLYDYQNTSTGNPDFNATPPGPEWVRKVVGIDVFANVVRVHFVGASSRMLRVVHLGGLSSTQIPGLLSHQVTDAGLVHLQGLSQTRIPALS